MLRTKAILTCDGCGKTVVEEDYLFDYEDALSLIRRSMFTQYNERGEETCSSLGEKNKTLCKECSEAYRKARAALTDGFMGGAE